MGFLVTNRHVVEGVKELVARFNRPLTLASEIVPLPLYKDDGTPLWTMHPTGADVAVIPISLNKLDKEGIEYGVFQEGRNTLSLQQARDSEISEGNGVFVLGFPLGQAGEDRNYVIVRQGVIARAQDWLKEQSDGFLIDASVFPGNSGGPVVTKPEAITIQGTKAHSSCSLIGMVSSYIPYRDVAISQQTGNPRITFEENSGLGKVVPIDKIQETIALSLQNAGIDVQNLPVSEDESPTKADTE